MVADSGSRTSTTRSPSAASQAKWIVSSTNWPETEKKLAHAGQKVPLSLELNASSLFGAVQLYMQMKVQTLTEEEQHDSETTRPSHELSISQRKRHVYVGCFSSAKA
ncbi:hypothetical protein V8F33_008352 [Rhypophila sp. PSN 637]